MAKTRAGKLMGGKAIKVDPVEVVILAALGGLGLVLAHESGARSVAQKQIAPPPRQLPPPHPHAGPARVGRETVGAVGRTMGGRGPGAGRGVMPHLGGRAPEDPYDYTTPSSIEEWADLP